MTFARPSLRGTGRPTIFVFALCSLDIAAEVATFCGGTRPKSIAAAHAFKLRVDALAAHLRQSGFRSCTIFIVTERDVISHNAVKCALARLLVILCQAIGLNYLYKAYGIITA